MAIFLKKVHEFISVRLSPSIYIAPPFYASLFVNVHIVQIKVDQVVTNTAPPYVFASLSSKIIPVPIYTLPLIIVTPAPK